MWTFCAQPNARYSAYVNSPHNNPGIFTAEETGSENLSKAMQLRTEACLIPETQFFWLEDPTSGHRNKWQKADLKSGPDTHVVVFTTQQIVVELMRE